MSNNIPKRSIYIDLVKGIAIILVVIGHCIQYGSGSFYLNGEKYFENLWFRIIYSFHMPLFMVISGYLYYYTCTKNSILNVFLTKVQSLGVPILAWGTLDFIIWLLSGNGDLNLYTIKIYILMLINAPWFLWATLLCALSVLMIKVVTKDSVYAYVLVIPFFVIFPDNYNLVWLKFMYPYFLTGYLWNKYNIKTYWRKIVEDKKRIIILTLVLLCLYFCMIPSFHTKHYIYNSYISIWGKNSIINQIEIDIFRWAIGYVGISVFLIFVSFLSAYIRESSFFVKIGKKTLGIYLISGYINRYILVKITADICPNYIIWIIESVIVILICYVLTIIIEKNRVLNVILFGNRKN